MRVAIVNNQAPFLRGGAELLAEWLALKLMDYGHQAEVVRLPFQWRPSERIVDHMLATRLVRVANADRVIAMKFPAYYVRHDDKVLWLLHQFRQAYDLWGGPFQEIPGTPTGHRVREAVIAADRAYLPEAKRIYTNSHIVGERLKVFSRLDSEPLFPPLLDASPYCCEEYGDYFFYPSRINAIKRQHVVVEAMARLATPARLVIAGPPDTPQDLDRLRDAIARGNLGSSVEVIPHWISDEEKLKLLARARGVVYIPVGEDSYGYVTLEAFHARKPVVTMADSGGTQELVRHGSNGLVADDVQGLAEAIEKLCNERDTAEAMGAAALDTISELDISWERVIRCLTS